MQETVSRQGSQIAWMKNRLREKDDNNVIGVVRKWDFIKKKINLMLKKVQNAIGQRYMNRKVIGFRIWLDEAENFLKFHSREHRNAQEILKIKVFSNLYFFIR